MAAPGRATVSSAEYGAYMNSSAWAKVRARYWASALPSECYVCSAPRRPGMHLHHRTYKNLGAERLMDLVPLCPECHALVHESYDRTRDASRGGLWAATKRVRVQVQREQRVRAPKQRRAKAPK